MSTSQVCKYLRKHNGIGSEYTNTKYFHPRSATVVLQSSFILCHFWRVQTDNSLHNTCCHCL